MAAPQQKNAELSVLFVAAEMVPFAKEGGLADVACALPLALAKKSIEVVAVMPLYGQIDRARYGLIKADDVAPITIEMGEKTEHVSFWRSSLGDRAVPVYFVENETFFSRPGVYTDPSTGEGFPDNAKRFILFQKAVLHLIRALPKYFDIVHCNDHHTGLLPYYIKRDPDLRDIAILFSIHNLAYQGIEPPELLPVAGIPAAEFAPMSPLEYYGKINMMKIGIHFADILSTVSPTYAIEISSSNEYGYGLEGVLQNRSDDLIGIINGIDTDIWNPATDELISHNYSASDPNRKKANKHELLRHFGLPVRRKRVPLIGMVGRLVDQKGLDILEEALDDMLTLDIQMVVLGTGQQRYHEMLEAAALRHPKKLAVKLVFDNELAHMIEAGSDMFLMPSRYEPCGLNQLYSLAYGTVPIVRATGGLADTVQAYDPAKNTGTGFLFEEYRSDALFTAVQDAVKTYADEYAWSEIMKNGMEQDFSWKSSAAAYIDLYRLAISKRNSTGE